ncbi:hypothetical protein BDZ91DRAFT_474880 [Kalaharituber pfeilii]|nr:hypothetical protein BDZ91DRAFT_474880 [Kalaharituber pfeilii]
MIISVSGTLTPRDTALKFLSTKRKLFSGLFELITRTHAIIYGRFHSGKHPFCAELCKCGIQSVYLNIDNARYYAEHRGYTAGSYAYLSLRTIDAYLEKDTQDEHLSAEYGKANETDGMNKCGPFRLLMDEMQTLYSSALRWSTKPWLPSNPWKVYTSLVAASSDGVTMVVMKMN